MTIKAITISAIAAAAASFAGLAQAFPDRPMTLIVPWGAGGGSDTVARAWGAAMEKQLGQPLQVVNKPGGGGLAGVPDFMSAPKDGYTLFQTVDIAIADYAAGRLKENPATDWAPVCATQITFSQLYMRPDETRWSDFAGFLAYAKANPGDVTVANVGNPGVLDRLLVDFLENALDFETRTVSFDKPAERYASLIGRQVDIMLEQPGDVRNFTEAGQMKPFLTFFNERPAAFADVPSHREVGADFEPLLRFRGFWTHPDVPSDRQATLVSACEQAFADPDYAAFNKSKFMDVIDSYRGGEEYKQLIATSIDLYEEALSKAGL